MDGLTERQMRWMMNGQRDGRLMNGLIYEWVDEWKGR